jgi:hypothetical protein
MTVQCDRGRIGGRHTGAWCTQATAIEGRGGHRPKPDRSKAIGRLGRVLWIGRSRSAGLRLATVGSAEAGPGVTTRRSRSCVRPRPDGEPGSPCLGADEDRQAPAPNETVTTLVPRRGLGTRMSHRRVPRRFARRRTGGAGTDAVSDPHRSEGRTVAKDPARERRCQTQGAVRAQSPEGGRNLLAC